MILLVTFLVISSLFGACAFKISGDISKYLGE